MNKMKYLVLVLCVLISGCQGVRVGVYHDFAGHTAGDKQVFMLEAPIYKNGNYSCEYRHESKVFTGRPFNSEIEGTFDLLGCSYEFK